jgi:Domain of unknown function (DUF4360)
MFKQPTRVWNQASVKTLCVSIILGASTLAMPTFAAPAKVQLLTMSGSGCPRGQGTISSIAPDLSSFTVDFAGYSASRLRRNCMFLFNVQAPAGYTYAVAEVPVSGDYNLAANATGYFDAYYYFTGMADTATTQEVITNDGSGAWSSAGFFAPEERVFAPCNASRSLAVNTALRVTGDSSGVSNLAIDPSFTVALQWKRCN